MLMTSCFAFQGGERRTVLDLRAVLHVLGVWGYSSGLRVNYTKTCAVVKCSDLAEEMPREVGRAKIIKSAFTEPKGLCGTVCTLAICDSASGAHLQTMYGQSVVVPPEHGRASGEAT